MNDDLSLAGVAFAAGLAVLAVAGDHAAARSARTESSVEFVQSRIAGEPTMAIVSLRDQRITIYDATGWILRAPVSSGQKGRETPAGIFSVIQKEAEHYSNLYDDAYMPHMQRITWSGIALHGGPLPGYPASHGCIRLPYDFAARLFDLTRLGMRVIVAPTDVTPIEIAHPALFMPKPGADALAAERAAEAEDVASKAATAKLAAVTASRDAAQARMAIRVSENLKRRMPRSNWRPPKQRSPPRSRTSKRSELRKPGQRRPPGSKNCRRNWPPPRPSCNQSSMPSRLRASLPTPPRPLGSRQCRPRASLRARSNRYRCLSAARLSAFMSAARFSRSWRSRSRSWIPNVRSARMSLRPWSGPMATPGCDGASSPWKAGVLDGDVVDRRVGASRGPEGEPTAKEPSDAKTALDRIVIPPEVIGSYRRDGVAAVFFDHLGRGAELGDRQGHGFRRPPER